MQFYTKIADWRSPIPFKFRNFPEPPTPGIFSKVSPVQMGGVLRYKWEAYCGTNWRCTAAFPFLQSLEASKAQRYKWGAYCGTNWRCTASTFQTSCTRWGFLNSSHFWTVSIYILEAELVLGVLCRKGGTTKKGCAVPKGPNLEKFKILKISSELEIFKRATHQTPYFLVGNSGGQD